MLSGLSKPLTRLNLTCTILSDFIHQNKFEGRGAFVPRPFYLLEKPIMEFNNGFYDLPSEKLATVVTSLEMLAKPALQPRESKPDWELVKNDKPEAEWYRDLYRRIGEEWLWFSRAIMPEDELTAIICDPKVEIYALNVDGKTEGLLELDFRTDGECELAFLGVTENIISSGAGKWLMNHAINLAWDRNSIKRLWIHTCTLDHPRALPFYIRTGFTPYQRQLEIADDPRITGIYSRDTAGYFPVMG